MLLYKIGSEILDFLRKLKEKELLSATDTYLFLDHLDDFSTELKDTHIDSDSINRNEINKLYEIPQIAEKLKNDKENYLLWSPKNEHLTISCLDPSDWISTCLKSFASSIHMSATLEPFKNYQEKIRDLKNLPSMIEKTLLVDNDIQAISSTFNEAKGSMFLGRGFSFPIALEGALKLKELSYVHAEGYPAGEMKHGPLALIEEGMPVVVLAPRDSYYKKTISNMQEVIARGAKVLLITNKSKDEIVSENIWETIEVENTNDDLLPFLLTVPLQKLAYYSSLKKGYDIDKPRNLAKSVTVE